MIKNAFYLIRSLQIFLKFGVILFIPNILNNTTLANYGYINTVVNILIVLYGLEFWYIYNRETSRAHEVEELLSKQYNNYLYLYVVFTPALIYLMRDFDNATISMVIIYGILSHLIQEIVRSLIHVERLTESAVVNIMQSIWIFMFCMANETSLEYLLISMLLASVLSLLCGLYFLKALKVHKVFSIRTFSISRILNDLGKIKVYFFSSLCMRLALSVPILFYKHVNAEDFLVIYSYYYALATGIEFFIYHFVQAKFIAKLVYANANNKRQYLISKRLYFIQNFAFVLILLGGGVLFCYYLLPLFIKNKFIIDGFAYGMLILISVAIISYGNYYAVILYSQHKDQSNIFAPLVSFFIAFIFSYVCYSVFKNVTTVGYIYILTFAITLSITRYLFWLKYDAYEKKTYIY